MAFLFKLETADGVPAEPPTLSTATPDWRPGHTIPLGGKTLRVVGLRDDADQPPVLIVEEAGSALPRASSVSSSGTGRTSITGRAPNAIELHPILGFDCLSG